MDQHNFFETPTTAKLHRAEYVVAFALTTGLAVAHYDEIRWLPALGLFLYIDVVGYLPGALAYRRSRTKQLPKVYYVLYNTMHSLITQGAVVALWCWLIGPEWALLAVPWHLFGDRGLFGNFLKPYGQPFEPVRDPRFSQLLRETEARAHGRLAPDPLPPTELPDEKDGTEGGEGDEGNEGNEKDAATYGTHGVRLGDAELTAADPGAGR
ncbi:hypothetical protein [Streptomyces iconiensis]|uniref:Integral membrane protein n=1 Tax=Streptomyces iconiensis TaxID=1384038 RepID=A0ABT7A4T4_9ACTN|nr:hypothetical protein [Streptomyces iconiensis]MDJ1135806.1 hypothetical protein [Streptomyces iconiensis]